MGFQPGANLYTQGFGSRPENVEVPHIDTRSPGPSDVNYPIGKHWINQTDDSSHVLTSISALGGTLQAFWISTGGGSTSIAEINNNSPVGGNYTLAGTTNQISVAQTTGTTIFSIPTSPQLPGTVTSASGFTATTGNITATLGDIIATNGNIQAAGNIIASKSASAATVSMQVTNSNNTTGTSNAALEVATGGSSSGDPTVSFEISGVGVATMTMGLDNSASDIFTISNSGTLGTNNALTLTQAGALTTTAGITSGGSVTVNGSSLTLAALPNRINITTGANSSAGTSDAMVAGSVTVNTNVVSSDSLIFVIPAVLGTVTTPKAAYISAKVASTSFTITSEDATDTSTWNYLIIN